MPDESILESLEAEQLIRRAEGRWLTTRRWQAAMARAALMLYGEGAPWVDLRLPIAAALVELCPDLDDGAIADRVMEMFEIESEALRKAVPGGAAPPA